MPVTLEQVRRLLMPDEPNYTIAAKLGPQAFPHLRSLVNGKDQMLASKAAYLATLIDHEGAVAVLGDAAKSPSAVVRVAAASGARNVRHPSASGIVSHLLNDKDTGVRKMAIKAAADSTNSAVLAQLGNIVGKDPSPANRALASHVLSRMKGGGRIA